MLEKRIEAEDGNLNNEFWAHFLVHFLVQAERSSSSSRRRRRGSEKELAKKHRLRRLVRMATDCA